MMKIVCLADSHGRHSDIDVPDGDILIHAGDFLAHQKQMALFDFNRWFTKQPHTYKIIIAGNHDWILREYYKETFSDSYYLEDESIEIEGIKFYGSPQTPIIQWEKPFVYYRKSKEAIDIWNRIPEDTNVLITHGPPRGILDMTIRYENVGCYNLLDRVLKVKPKVHIFGHIHESYGVIEQRYGIKFVNCSQLDEDFSLTNKPIVFDYEIK